MSAMIGNPLLLSTEGYNIQRSVRLRSSASAYFSRTPGVAGSRTTWTWSGWVKRGSLDGEYNLFNTGTSAPSYDGIRFLSNSLSIFIAGGSPNSELLTTAVFRDSSAWYHVVLSVDTTQATASNRLKLHVNGTQITSFASAIYPAQNSLTTFNSTLGHTIGVRQYPSAVGYFDGYLTEINFIDGQALTPSSFGEFDTITGAWKPKKYSGTYGTNGFYLNFSDPSAATATAIGKDYSGNGNNWTPTNVSLTAGATYDSMLDVPTQWADGGNGRGNYCTLNPLAVTASTGICSDGNLFLTTIATNGGNGYGTIALPSSGKYYWEVAAGSVTGELMIGAGTINSSFTYWWLNAGSVGYASGSGNKYINATGTTYGAAYTTNDVVGVAVDLDSSTVTFYKNGVSQGAIAYNAAGLHPAVSDASTPNASTATLNFGQRPFAYTPPSGFKALHTGNLPEPSIKKPNQWFDATTYTGNGSTQSIVNGGAFQPDLVWAKARSSASYSHRLIDSVRGVNVSLQSNTTNGDTSEANSLTAFNSNGFSLGSDGVGGGVNTNAVSYVAWQWKEGATPGFDIVTYTGNATNRTIAHSLGVAPAMIICKSRGSAQSWQVYHAAVGATRALYLNLTNAQSAASALYWNNTAPTSSVFSLGTDAGGNDNAQPFVAYLFADVPGFSRFGSYTGNGSSDGPFVFCGFRPRWVMVKRTDATGNWVVWDTARVTYNVNDTVLYPNLSNADDTNASQVGADVLSNGFKLRGINGSLNISGGTYIFAAFAENPFKYALAR